MAAYASVRAKTGTIRQPKCSPRKAFPATKLTVREPRWCYYQGKAGNEKACILIVASPSNLNYPEPLRVWDKTVNKPAGDVMWNFSPTKQKAFTLEPGKELSLSYRIYVLDKNINATTAEVLSDFERD